MYLLFKYFKYINTLIDNACISCACHVHIMCICCIGDDSEPYVFDFLKMKPEFTFTVFEVFSPL